MSDTPAEPLSLVADIGGTNTRVAMARGRKVDTDSIKRFRNADHPGLESVLCAYLDARGNPDCKGACIAVAGPVRDGCATMTNLDWQMDQTTLARASKAETVSILNDLQAQGHALDHIAPGNLRQVIAGAASGPHAAKLVIGVGTGFNAAPVYNTGTGRYVPPAEAGHATLPVRTEADFRLARFLEQHHGFAAVEEVLSGRGLTHVHDWLNAEAGGDASRDPAAIIDALAAGDDPRAREAAAVFVRMLGCVAGDLALEMLPFGGVYLIGGVTRAIAPHLTDLGFTQAFRDKGRFGPFMEQFAVHIVEDDYAALTGCAGHLAGLIETGT
ncbi:glucokinase [Oceaniglobus indicus]|uniref:glucokinase n=1 Tax=Oceaniglobus indicus TaxID=2047749 RepID=UPI000C17BF98|nr:glucokinase [Oceaniglobus indicus]